MGELSISAALVMDHGGATRALSPREHIDRDIRSA
jgi:hypothetical protein